jgi:hypothetical protein
MTTFRLDNPLSESLPPANYPVFNSLQKWSRFVVLEPFSPLPSCLDTMEVLYPDVASFCPHPSLLPLQFRSCLSR